MIINEIDTEKLINFQYIIDLVTEQFESVMSTDPEFYSSYSFDIANEQYYVPDEDREPGKIYIVIKFSPAQIDYGQDVIPFTIQAVSESNGLVGAQRLLLEYAQIFNLQELNRDDKIIYQAYTTPNVISNFDIVYDGFRSVLVMSGTVLLSNDINRITLKYYDGDYASFDFPHIGVTSLENNAGQYVWYNEKIYKWDGSQYVEWDYADRIYDNVGLADELVAVDMFNLPNKDDVYVWDSEQSIYVKSEGTKINILSFNDMFDASPDTQPYFKNKNFTASIVKFGTYSFNITSFLTKNALNNKVLQIIKRKKPVDSNFYFKICYDDESLNMPLLRYKMVNCSKQQNKGEMPSMALAFTN